MSHTPRIPVQYVSPLEAIAVAVGVMPAPRQPLPPINGVDAALIEAQAEPTTKPAPKRGRHAVLPEPSPARKIARKVIPAPVRAAVRDKLRIQSAQ